MKIRNYSRRPTTRTLRPALLRTRLLILAGMRETTERKQRERGG